MEVNTLHHNCSATVREIYDLTKEEAFALILQEEINVNSKNHAVILTSKNYGENSSFSARSSQKLLRDFTWIHCCPQEILNFDDDTSQGEKYYVMVFESVEK